MFCTECGAAIAINSKFCSSCGTSITPDENSKKAEPVIVKNEDVNIRDSSSTNNEPKSLPAVLLLMGLVVIPICVGVYFTNPDIQNFVNNSKSDAKTNNANRSDGPATEAAEAVAVEGKNSTSETAPSSTEKVDLNRLTRNTIFCDNSEAFTKVDVIERSGNEKYIDLNDYGCSYLPEDKIVKITGYTRTLMGERLVVIGTALGNAYVRERDVR